MSHSFDLYVEFGTEALGEGNAVLRKPRSFGLDRWGAES
jgi:hypothetical protein